MTGLAKAGGTARAGGRIRAVGFSTGGVGGDLDRLAARLDRLVELGCDGAEITAVGLDAVTDCRLVPQRVAALRALTASRPLAYSLHAPIAINLMDEAHAALQRRAFAAALDLAGEIGAAVVVVHPGRCPPRDLLDRGETLLALEREALAALAPRARDRGVRIAYENMSPNQRIVAGVETSYALDPARLADQIAALNLPEVVACLDVSHARQGATLWGFDMLAACARLAPHVGHIHFSDSTGGAATVACAHEAERCWFGMGDMHAPPGWGAVDFEALAAALDVRPDTRIVIELRENFLVHAEAETLAAARAFAALLDGA